MIESAFVKLKDPAGIKALKYLAENEPKTVSIMFHEMLHMMDKANGLLATYGGLADVCGYSEMTARRAIDRLVELKFIQSKRTGHGTFYFINAELATRISKRIETYSAGYELWSCKVLVKA